jgi:cyclic pyranopterin phosphate synthase
MGLSHVNRQGEANMVDVSDKAVTAREAIAQGTLLLSTEAFAEVSENRAAKGDVLAAARIAGIQGAKQCANLIPLCHPLALSKVDITFEFDAATPSIVVQCRCKLKGQTGVEMEALTGVNVALLTLFDMCKAVDPNMTMTGIHVLEKRGGKSGDWQHGHR